MKARNLKFNPFYFILLSCVFSSGFGQLHVDYPKNRMVVQRNNQNEAHLQIAGYVDVEIDRIEARLLPVQEYQGQATDWQTISQEPTNSQYIGSILGKGGWYTLEVRAIRDEKIIASHEVSRVGIGEVFVIAGQSNAEGNSDFEGAEIGAQDDRVSVIDYKQSIIDEDQLPFVFNQLHDGSRIGPYNPVPWFWGRMAEKIVQQYNVPVLLFGSAVGGTSSLLWYGSMLGFDYSKTDDVIIKFPGSPYDILRKTLQNYVSRTGLRAILWQQGESDSGTFPNVYYDRIKAVVEQTSIDFDARVNWIMAVASRTPHVSSAMYGQLMLINGLENVYEGPNTDLIYGPEYRADGIHFHKGGLDLVAAHWYLAIQQNNLFDKIPPTMPKPFVLLDTQCGGAEDYALNLSFPEGFGQPKWSNGISASNTTLNYGTLSGKARKNGVVYFSPGIAHHTSFFNKEKINLIGESTYCENVSDNYLQASTDKAFWSNGFVGDQLVPTSSGDYFFQYKNHYGCSLTSESIHLEVLNSPKTNWSSSTGQTDFCDNTTLALEANGDFPAYSWSTGESTKQITVNEGGEYSFYVQGENGCFSDTTAIQLHTLAAPQSPVIDHLNPFELHVINESLNTDFAYHWYAGETNLDNNSTEIKVTQTGLYRVKSDKVYTLDNAETLTCSSAFSNDIEIRANNLSPAIKVWPNPSRGSVQVEMLNREPYLYTYLYSEKGQLLQEGEVQFENGSPKIEFQNLSKGVYFIKTGSRNNFVTHKIVVIE
ncbi:T9SS type A sorting domain-containing protein [Marinilongibacter aquaticus]|uniref:sialate O-acetylesterase n=1 Tax=Marinilongibacter aquaticus TaxID=2975157 RepID=UPI0021BD8CF1|nr:sialate O-acetylesterase [Marinilongibacter aquaticus]UBM60333.1 T9SS type A sorting domain-containing protein [Marinilongibacter aquaticus]